MKKKLQEASRVTKYAKENHYDQNKTELHLVNPAHLVTLKLESQIALSSRGNVKAR